MGDRGPKNFVLCQKGMSYTGNALQNYTMHGFQVLYQRIYTKLAHLARCGESCSEKDDGNTTRRYGILFMWWHICHDSPMEWNTFFFTFDHIFSL